MLPRGAFKCTPFGDQNAEPWIMKEIHNKGEADEHFIYRAAGLSMQDDKSYPKGSFVDSADIQKFIKDLSQAQKYTQVNTITNTALGAAIQIPMMMEVPEGQEAKTALLDDDSPDCWIGTSSGSRKISLRMDSTDNESGRRVHKKAEDVTLNMFFVKMTVCKRTEAFPGTRIVKDKVTQLGEGEGVAEGSSGGAILELQEGEGGPGNGTAGGSEGGSTIAMPKIDTPMAGAVMMEGGKAFITKCDVKQTLIAAYGCPDEHAMKKNVPKPTGKPTDKPAALSSGSSTDQQRVALSGVNNAASPSGRRLLEDPASASSKISDSAEQKSTTVTPKQVIVEKGMCSTVVNKYLAMFM